MRVPRLHVVCPDEVLGRADFPARALGVLERGGETLALHLRPRAVPLRPCLETAVRLREAADRTGGWLVVNGRVDLAMASGAHGVQLGRGALPVEAVRRILPPGAAIGVSVHAEDEARRAAVDGADFLLVGTIFATPTHPRGPVGGPGRVRSCASAGVPVIAIGGIEAGRIAGVFEAGAHGVAVVRAVWDGDGPEEAVADLRREVGMAALRGRDGERRT